MLTIGLCVLLVGCSPGRADRRAATSGPTTPGGPPPAIVQAEAAQVLKRYLAAMNGSDPAATRSLEAGAARQVNARLRELGPRYALVDIAPDFAIPRLADYPKWFVAGAVGAGATFTLSLPFAEP